jgi:hypothetical protein
VGGTHQRRLPKQFNIFLFKGPLSSQQLVNCGGALHCLVVDVGTKDSLDDLMLLDPIDQKPAFQQQREDVLAAGQQQQTKGKGKRRGVTLR